VKRSKVPAKISLSEGFPMKFSAVIIKTVPAECHLRFCAEFAGRKRLSFFNRAHIGVAERNNPVLYMFFSGKLQRVLLIKQSQKIQRASRTFSSSRPEPAKCPA
jgi:hypothetical protein